MTANLLTLNSSKTEFFLIGLKQKLAKVSSCSLDKTHSARNLAFIFYEYITFSDQSSALSKSCYSHPSTSLHPTISRSQNSQYHCHLNRALQTWLLQLTLLQATKYSTKPFSTHPKFYLTRAVVRASKSSHINPALKPLHWLKIKQCI